MNSFLDPVGARPPAVYWRRRALVAAALAVVILVAARACSSGGPPTIGSQTGAPGPVPLVSTYTPTPKPTERILDAGDDALPGFQSGSGPGGAVSGASIASGGSQTTSSGVVKSGASGPVAAATATGGATAPGVTAYGATATTSGGSAAQAAGPAKPLATAKPTPSPTPTPKISAVPTKIVVAGPTTCKPSALAVRLRSDARTYTAPKSPRLFIAVENIGKKPCLVDLGSGALSLTVKSGKDRVWSSDDCQGKATRDIRLLEPGQKLEARSIWSKVRSRPGCPKGMPTAKPGTYVVEGSAGGVKAQRRVVFQLV